MNGMFTSLIMSRLQVYPKALPEMGNPDDCFHINRWRQWVGIHNRHNCIPDPLIIPALSTLGEMKVNVAVFVPNFNQ